MRNHGQAFCLRFLLFFAASRQKGFYYANYLPKWRLFFFSFSLSLFFLPSFVIQIITECFDYIIFFTRIHLHLFRIHVLCTVSRKENKLGVPIEQCDFWYCQNFCANSILIKTSIEFIIESFAMSSLVWWFEVGFAMSTFWYQIDWINFFDTFCYFDLTITHWPLTNMARGKIIIPIDTSECIFNI